MISKKPLLLVLTGLVSLSLLGCTTPSVIKEYVYVQAEIPADLIRPCDAVPHIPRTNGELAQTLLDAKQALAKCDEDKTALRELNAKRMAEPKPSGK